MNAFLVVSGDLALRCALRHALEMVGVEVDVVPDAEVASDLIRATPYDAVVVEVAASGRFEPCAVRLLDEARWIAPAMRRVAIRSQASPPTEVEHWLADVIVERAACPRETADALVLAVAVAAAQA